MTDVPHFRVLGVPVSAIQIPDTIAVLERWINDREASHYVAFTGMHGVCESIADPQVRTALNAASLVVPDGMPLVWIGRRHGYNLPRRVYGPELMETFCRVTGNRYRHFFYGGAEGVPERLAGVLEQRYGIQVAGVYSPPFRPLTQEVDRRIMDMIEGARPDVLWIGLSTPKQERWMYEHRDRLTVPAVLGVGAAFDLNSGGLRQAPSWMRENGLEWFFRLLAEPRRLWRRYLIKGSVFLWNISLELLNLRKFN
jgi:N-acetylglucosaminyldiphosphoundecaprenol N-acetyl-beta-D-mannosaminyltransferase